MAQQSRSRKHDRAGNQIKHQEIRTPHIERPHTLILSATTKIEEPGLTNMSLVLAISALLAQQTADQPPVVLKATTRLVQVSVIAQDGKGQPVTDLKKEDFRIKVNGKEQPIKIFSMDSSGALPHGEDKLPPNVFTNRLEVKPGQQ